MLSKATDRRGLYLAFNKSIAQDAQKTFPPNFQCSTVHSLAYRATPSEFKHGSKMTGRIYANALAQELKFKDWYLDGQKLATRSQAHLVLSSLKRFMHGDHDAISASQNPADTPRKQRGSKDVGSIEPSLGVQVAHEGLWRSPRTRRLPPLLPDL
jgi:hypothetical protein